MKNISLDPFFKSYIKVNFTWILEVNIKEKRIKVLEGKIEHSHDFEKGKDFLNRRRRHEP